MSSLPFLDIAFPKFAPENWRNGLSIFRSDGVSKIVVFSELVEGLVSSGIGDHHTVRLKLHKSGKGIQWMECSCASHRRRNELCSHIAALCIHLDQQRPDILEMMNLEGLTGDKFLNLAASHIKNLPPIESDMDQNTSMESSLLGESSDALNISKNINISKIESIKISPNNNSLLVEFKNKSKKYTLEFNVDDAVTILTNNLLPSNLKPKGNEFISRDKFIKLCFTIKELSDNSIEINKSLKLYSKNEESDYEIINLIDLPDNSIGQKFILYKQFIPIFEDHVKEKKEMWQAYPKKGILKGDVAAIFIESGFERLERAGDLIFDSEWKYPKVVTKISIKDLAFNKNEVNNFLIDEEFIEDKFLLNDGQTSSILKDILIARKEGRQYVKTKQGWLKVDDHLDWLKTNITKEGKIKFSTLEFIKFQKLLISEDSETSQQNLSIFEKIKSGIIGLKNIPAPEISGHGMMELRPYQEEGRQWLWWLYCNNLGGILADEMGLGKTHQAMGLMACIAATEKQPIVLVVCPTSVIDHWYDKISTYLDNVEVIPFHGSQRKRIFFSRNNNLTVVITSYGVLLRDINLIEKNNWNLVVLDEAHLVKNQRTRTYSAACRIKSKMRLCLTGTPLENDIMELKNLFDFIAPSYLNSDTEFKKRFLNENQNILADTELKRLIHPFQLRRRKNDVLKDLPEKVEDVKHCYLNKEQYRLYKEALALKGTPVLEQLNSSDNKSVSYVHVFSIITLLKQICNDPGLIDPRFDNTGSGKILLFQEILQEALDSGHKVVVFTQYARMVERLSKKLTSWGVDHVSLTGQTTKRGKVIEKFQNDPSIKVFIGSLLAGGTGIDLTSANVVIHFDRWWNSAKEDQATDRIHRIGQLKNVQVYKLVTRGTVESRIDEIILSKKKVFERFVEFDQDLFKNLSRQDLLELLAEPSEMSDW